MNFKHMIRIMGCILGAAVLLHSCNLEREPSDYVPFGRSYRNMSDASQWDNGIYSTLRGKFGGGYVLPQEVQADMLNAHTSYNGYLGSFHRWNVRSEDDVLRSIYHSYYAALLDANIVIEKAPALEVLPEERDKLNTYLGNAYFARAFYHFNLALRWGTPYKESSKDKDLGVPLQTRPFALEKEGRATNAQTYELILADLDKAETLLAKVATMEGNTEISSDAVKALRARVYFYMGIMEKALEESEKLIASNRYPLIAPLPTGGKDPDGENNPFIRMWHYDSGKEQIWQPYVDTPFEKPTTTNLYGADVSTWTYWKSKGVTDKDFNKPAYLPTGTTIYDYYANEDRRVPAYFEYVVTTAGSDRNTITDLYVISKFKGNPKYRDLAHERWGGYVPNGVTAPKPFRMAEQYLMAAEAAYESGQIDKALTYLNTLRTSRGLSTSEARDEALRTAIREERTRELAYEGFRLWDLRRWGMEISARKRQGSVKEHSFSDVFFAQGFELTQPIPANHPKFVWGFPKDEVAHVNPKVKQNEGW